jgi:Tfp pilus assembly protein PilZ
MSDDKRRVEERVTINQEFESFDALIEEYVTNLSRRGAFLKTRHALTVGAKVNLRFTVLHEEMEFVEGVGEVVRVQHDPPGVGVVFSELSPASAAVIERLLARRGAS